MLGENYFGVVDYIVLLSSLIVCLLVGVYYGYLSKQTNEELLMGGRNMSVFPVAASVLVSMLSAITVLGFPSEIYAFGLQIYGQTIIYSFALLTSSYLMVPFLYPMKLTSIYEYLEMRYNSPGIRQFGASVFVVEQLGLCAMVLYAPSLALETFLGFPLWLSILGMGFCGTIYTSIGGLKAVVWVDTFQFGIMLAGIIGIIVKGFMMAGGVTEGITAAYENGRLQLVDFTVDPFMRHNFLNFFCGSFIVQSIRAGTHQLHVQRFSSLPTIKSAQRTMLLSVVLKIFMNTMYMLCGLAIYGAIYGCDPVKSGKISKVDQIVALFVVENLSSIPGYLGLFTACVFSAVLSSISSVVNSMATVTWMDGFSKIPYFQKMGPKAQTNISRALSLGYGILSMFLAFLCQHMGAIYGASGAVMGVSIGAIVGIFSMAIFMPCINKIGAWTGTVVAYLAIGYVAIQAFIHHPSVKLFLPVSTEKCNFIFPFQEPTMESITIATTIATEIKEESVVPATIYKLSYTLYGFVGALVAIFVGLVVSGLTGGMTKKQMDAVNPNYIHPLVRCLMRRGKETDVNGEKEDSREMDVIQH